MLISLLKSNPMEELISIFSISESVFYKNITNDFCSQIVSNRLILFSLPRHFDVGFFEAVG